MKLNRENGFSLIESIVGVAIVATAGLTLLAGLITATKAQIIHKDEVTSEILARGQMEYVVRQPYSTNPWSYNVTSLQCYSDQQPSWWDAENPPLLSDVYTGYQVSVTAINFDADEDGVLEVPGDDSDIYNVTIRVYRPDTKLLLTLENSKTNR
jgi:type II secretory pathway pseudopilin PulG